MLQETGTRVRQVKGGWGDLDQLDEVEGLKRFPLSELLLKSLKAED
jgi:hypothetical protein